MNTVDVVGLLLLSLAFLIGFRNGFVKSLLSLVSWIIAIYIAGQYGERFSVYTKRWFHLSDDLSRILAFVLVFVLVVLIINLFARFATGMLNLMMMGLINKILGGVFNVMKYILILSFLLMIINSSYNYRVLTEQQRADSVFYEPVAALAPAIFPHIQRNLHQFERLWTPKDELPQNEPVDSTEIQQNHIN